MHFFYLSQLYEDDLGTQKDDLKAKEYLEKSARMNNSHSLNKLGNFYETEQNYRKIKDKE